MTSPPEQQLSSLSQLQWEDLFKRLLMFTHKRYGWLKELSGLDLQDIVQQAIIDTLEGKRRWPPKDSQTGETDPNVSLFLFLCNVIRSDVSHLREKELRKSRTEVHKLDLDLERLLLEESQESGKDLLQRRSAFLSNLNSESMALYHELTERIHKAVADDQELTKVVDLLLYTPDSKPGEIAEQLGLSIQQIYRILKRLRRAKEEVFEDGMESDFTRGLSKLVEERGAEAILALTRLIESENRNDEIAAETLRWMGRLDHSSSYEARLTLIERSLGNDSVRVRDAASVALASFDDERALPALRAAIEREKYSELREDMQQILAQLEGAS